MEGIRVQSGVYRVVCGLVWVYLWGVVWDYMGLYLYKSGGKYRKMGVFCGFLVVFLCGSGWSSEKFRRCEGCKGF